MSTVKSTNPATGEVRVLDVEETSRAAVIELTERAGAVALEVAARDLSWRASLLGAMADELESDGEALVEAALFETALTRARLEGELRRTAFQLRFFAEVVRDGAFLDASIDHATDSPMGPLPDLRRVNVPLGPVAVFGSSNFPFAFSVPGGDTASALAAGCPVVIKAHPAHPATSLGCFRALERAATRLGAPEGLLGLVFGFASGEVLVDAPAITAVGFTGSVTAGRALWRRANERAIPIPFFGELGAANPLVVTVAAATSRAREIGEGVAGSMTLGAGQFCTKPGLLFVPVGDGGDELVAALIASLEAMSSMTLLSAGIAEHFTNGVAAVASTPGVTSLATSVNGESTVAAHLFSVAASTWLSAPTTLREECFGPSAIVVRYQDAGELRAALRVGDPALTFSVFTGADDHDAEWLLSVGATVAGRVIANGYPTGVGVSWSMQHGGPWPSTTVSAATSVGAGAITRWLRPVTFQNVADELLPPALREGNPLELPRRVDGLR